MFNTYFTSEQSNWLFSSLTIIFLSVVLFEFRKSKKEAIVLLLLGSLGIRIFAALLDPFLNMWDEQYHALVAKNMLENPFHPFLYTKPVLSYDLTNWTHNHVWLHKQPLFLWQIAMSFKLFGVNEFTLRLPSVLMCTAIVWMIFRIGTRTLNERIGFYGALLFALGNYSIELSSGVEHTDHNDIAFLFYVTASIWAWVEYENEKSKRWIVLIGLFSGMAVLNKWLTGLLVFSGWAAVILFDKGRRRSLVNYKDLGISLVTAIIVFLPWQLYIIQAFPLESAYEYSLNRKHFFTPVEDHHGSEWYYLEKCEILYGQIAPYLLPLALFLLLRSLKKEAYKYAFCFFIFGVYGFFTLAATKMPAFPIIVCSLIYLAFSSLINVVLPSRHYGNRYKDFAMKGASVLIIFFIAIAGFNIKEIQAKHTSLKHLAGSNYVYRSLRMKAAESAKNIGELLPGKDYVLFNCSSIGEIQVMFYSGNTAYNIVPDEQVYNSLKEQGIKMAVMETDDLPLYLLNDTSVFKIRFPFLKRMEQQLVSLKADNGKYLCAEWNGFVVANRDSAKSWEQFTITRYVGNKCTIRSHTGKYFSADLNDNGKVSANRINSGEWELFTIRELGQNKIAFLSSEGKYLEVETAKEVRLVAGSDSISKYSEFLLENLVVK